MDKNTIIGFALMALVLIGFSIYNQPSEAEIARQQALRDSLELVQQNQELAEKKAIAEAKVKAETASADSTSILFEALNGKGEEVVLENNLVKVTLNTKGGMPVKAELKDYKNQDRTTNVTLFDEENDQIKFTIEGKNENIISSDLVWQTVESNATSATLRLPVGQGSLDFVYTLSPDNYMVNLDIKANNVANYFSSNTKNIVFNMEETAKQLEKGFTFENRYATLTYKENKGGTDYLSETRDDEEEIEKPLDWFAFKNQFFSVVFIADKNFSDVNLVSKPQKKESGYLKAYEAQASANFDPSGNDATQLQFYFGPNHFKTLQAANELSISHKDLDLEELVYLGWPLFRYINRWFTLYVFDWLSGFGMNMGIVLLLMTILMNIIVFYPRYKSFRSTAKMKALKPKVDEINAKYPNQEDAMRKQQEIMQLYSQYGVSPMGGCLPMLIQMPVWIALFNFVPNAIELRQQSFLFADDLSTYDDIISWGFNLPAIGNHLSIFCLAFCATNIITSWINMKQQDTGANPQMAAMKWMMYLMPVMFFFIFNDYSSGLCWYYFVSGLISVGIMWAMKATTDDAKLLAQLEKRREERKANPKLAGKSSFQERLQKLAEQQQEVLRKQQEEQQRRNR